MACERLPHGLASPRMARDGTRLDLNNGSPLGIFVRNSATFIQNFVCKRKKDLSPSADKSNANPVVIMGKYLVKVQDSFPSCHPDTTPSSFHHVIHISYRSVNPSSRPCCRPGSARWSYPLLSRTRPPRSTLSLSDQTLPVPARLPTPTRFHHPSRHHCSYP